jgi:hypothetical protein
MTEFIVVVLVLLVIMACLPHAITDKKTSKITGVEFFGYDSKHTHK